MRISSKRNTAPHIVGVRFVAAAATLLAVCCTAPTEVCACAPIPSFAILRGVVHHPGGNSAAGVAVRVRTAPAGAPCLDDMSGWLSVAETVSAGDASFTMALSAPFTSAARCVRAIAYAGVPGASDSAWADGTVTFRAEGVKPDTLRLVITLP